jgi:pimeloyl-ACP methyl ester carboxylesterase
MTTLPTQFIEALSVRLAYVESGKGVVLVCLHDVLDCADTFGPLMGWVDWGRWIALDLPGSGESALPVGPFYGVSTMARYVSEALEQLGLFRVILVGHGFGAAVAAWVASHDTERVRGVCLINPSFQTPRLPVGLRLSRRPMFRWLSRYLLGERVLRWRLRSRMLHAPKPERATRLAQTFTQQCQERLSLLQGFSEGERDNLIQRLSLLQIPVLCLQGAQGPTDTSWQEKIPYAAKEIIAGCAQYPHEEQPEQVATLLQRWIESFS